MSMMINKIYLYIPQEPLSSLNPLLTIEEHFKINEKLQVSNNLLNTKIIDLINKLNFEQDAKLIMKLYPHELSGGMAQGSNRIKHSK